ncbi:MAG: SOS response-associated peptidase [Chloroflexi bacterium]|nr:SOS response-associated peptidase [Chloroflexota bacterium]
MCGRYSLIADITQLAMRFEFEAARLEQPPRYNIAPTQPVLSVRGGGPRYASYMRWGLVPSGANSMSVGPPLINARAETLSERPSFRAALRERRCLIPADGFYEWRRGSGSRSPVRVTMASGEPFAFAGLWDTWRHPGGEHVTSCTIVTTEANELLQPVHDRMPVILPRELEPLWLNEEVRDPALLSSVLVPYDSGLMDAHEVSTLVNSAVNEGPELWEPPQQTRLL